MAFTCIVASFCLLGVVRCGFWLFVSILLFYYDGASLYGEASLSFGAISIWKCVIRDSQKKRTSVN